MKTIRWSVLAIVALSAVSLLLARGGATQTAGADSEERALRREVEQLQARLKMLEQRLAKVEPAKPGVVSRIEILPKSPGALLSIPMPPLPGQRDRSGQQPKIWGGGEINGWPYCYIPCQGR